MIQIISNKIRIFEKTQQSETVRNADCKPQFAPMALLHLSGYEKIEYGRIQNQDDIEDIKPAVKKV